MQCPHCFYLDRRLGVSQPPGFPFNLNSAVDHLLKKEFDTHRREKTPHPLMVKHGIDAIPFNHERMDEWRENFKGLQYLHPATNLIITGAIDDLWINSKGEIIVVDYKSTSKDTAVTIDAEWQGGYKRQMEIYQWLVRNQGFPVSATGYFVYCNGRRDLDGFNQRLEFDISVLPYTGNDSWVENAIIGAHACLQKNEVPPPSPTCDYCMYRMASEAVLKR